MSEDPILHLSTALQDAIRCFSNRECIVTPERLDAWERTLEEFGRCDCLQGTSTGSEEQAE